MIKFIRESRRNAYWLAGQFDRKAHPLADRAMAAWSEILGHEQARLWMNARATEGRGR